MIKLRDVSETSKNVRYGIIMMIFAIYIRVLVRAKNGDVG
jgi:hypothetical protein